MSIAIYVFLVSLVITCQLSHAQDDPEDFLVAHNEARSRDDVGPLEWSEELATFARAQTAKMKAKCEMVPSGSNYGENQEACKSELFAHDVVKQWVGEEQWYNYSANTCNSGKDCSHYTQVVWADTKKVGCAKDKCGNGGTVIACYYEPHGNIMGERPFFDKNVFHTGRQV